MKKILLGFFLGVFSSVGLTVIAAKTDYCREYLNQLALQQVKENIYMDTQNILKGELLLSVDKNPFTDRRCEVVRFDPATLVLAPVLPAIPISSYEYRYRQKVAAVLPTDAQFTRCYAAFHGYFTKPTTDATISDLYDADAWLESKAWIKIGIVPAGTTCEEKTIRVRDSDGAEYHYTQTNLGARGLSWCIK